MPLADTFVEGTSGAFAFLGALADGFNDFEGTTPASFEPVGAWTTYTPALTADTTNPTLGSGSIAYGRYKQNGKEVKCQFVIRFGSSGRNKGSGQYSVSLPVTAAAVPSGLTSVMVGHGGLWRAYNGLDLIGAHPEVWFYVDPSSGNHVGIVGNAIFVPRESSVVSVTSSQTGIANTGADLTSLTTTITQKQSTTRWKVRGLVRVGLDASAPRSAYLNIQEGATVLGSAGTSIGATGSGLTNTATLIAETPIFIPSSGDHTYKLNAFADPTGNFSMYASATNPAFIEAVQQPGLGPITSGSVGNIDYVSDSNPWDWSAQAGQAEIWGSIRYEAA